MEVRRLNAGDPSFARALDDLLAWDSDDDNTIESTVAGIIADVRDRDDAAVIEWTNRLDRRTVTDMAALQLDPGELSRALDNLAAPQRAALELAAHRVRDFHQRQVGRGWHFEDEAGNRLGQRITPLERVGVYVPGGQAAYPSTVLMTVIPARVAGVGEVIVTVPMPDGVANPLVLAAMALAGVDRVFTIGGAQAVAALAYGTQTVPRVDKIVGPGGAYVAAAKRRVFGQVGIDLIAGPSEILVIADDTASPEWVALDLFSQAEHDASAQSILVSPSADLLDSVQGVIRQLLPGMQRREIIRASLQQRGAFIQVDSMEQAMEVANRVAPEHLQLSFASAADWVDRVRHAGAIFVGPRAAEAMGDYVAGPSHVLPTYGTARFSSPLGVYDFEKRTSVIELSEAGAAELGEAAAVIADGEGLEAHARAARARTRSAQDGPGLT